MDKLTGGLADKKKPSDFDKEALEEGIRVEREHTDDDAVAREIAMDHLSEDPKYYKKLKTIEKQDRIETTADGKTELDVGAEPLDKLKNRWSKLKKALDSNKSIMDVSGQEYNPDEDEQENQEQAESDQPEDQGSTDQEQESAPSNDESEDQGNDSSAENSEESPSEEEIIEMLRDEGYSDAEIAHIVHGHSIPVPTKDDHAATNEKMDGDLDRQLKIDEASQEKEHKKRMDDLEYERAKSEIADPEVEKNHRKRMLDLEHEAQKKKSSKEDLELEHRKKLQELELAAKQKEIEKQDPAEEARAKEAQLQLEHKKRMMDLEYEKAKKEAEKGDPTEEMKRKQLEFELALKKMEKELELEFKKKELALKLKLTEEAAKQKHEHAQQQAEADAAVNAEVKANQAKHKISESKKPPKKEPIGNGRSK